MYEISECVSKAKAMPAFDEKFVNNPNLSDQRKKSVKRKRESEPIRRVKKMRLEKKIFLSERQKCRSQFKPKSRSKILRELRNGSEQQDNAKEIISLDSCLSFDYKECSWPVNVFQYVLSASSISSVNYSCDASDPDVDIPNETPDYINNLASRAEFAAYQFGKVLGAGAFGQVIAATHKEDNLPVALKFVHKSTVKEFKEIQNGKEIPAEAYLQHRAQNRNVIDIYEVIDIDDYFVYVMERPEKCKDMFDIIAERGEQNQTLTEKEVRKYFSQVLQANICCEENGVLHRDIKPENILVDLSCDEAKLIDFGLSSEVQQKPFAKFRGTRNYTPPEFTKCNEYDDCQGTVWQMGILLVDMLSPDIRAFEHPRDAVTMPPSSHSAALTRSKEPDLFSVEHQPIQSSNSKTNSTASMVRHDKLTCLITTTAANNQIIVPALSYSEALHSLNLRTLDERRSELCVKTLEKISRGGPLVKHLPMTKQRMHNYQTICAENIYIN